MASVITLLIMCLNPWIALLVILLYAFAFIGGEDLVDTLYGYKAYYNQINKKNKKKKKK